MKITKRDHPEQNIMLSPRNFFSLFDEFTRIPDIWEDYTPQVRAAAADIYETENNVVAEIAVAGINKDDINITVSGDTLTVSGETKKEEETEKREYYQKQLRYGNFAQSLILPSTVQADKAKANFKNGILKITIPKSEEAKQKQIKIEDGE